MWFPYSLPAHWKAESKRESVNDSLADGRTREFLVGFYLNNPVTREWGVELQLKEPCWVQSRADEPPIAIGYYPNERDRLTEIICRVVDTSPATALRRCHGHVSRLLSHWSALEGRGFAIGGFRVADLDHDARWRALPHRPSAQPFAPSRPADLPAALWPVAALYREARSSASDRYRFLCCYKLLGLWAARAGAFAAASPEGAEPEARIVTQEMLVVAGAFGQHPEWEGLDFHALLAALEPWQARALACVGSGDLPEQAEDYEGGVELAALANLVDLAVHQILRDRLESAAVVRASGKHRA